VTTYTLRKGAPEKTKADAVVVGVTSSANGPAVAPGGDGVASAYGRSFKPMLETLGVTGKAGEVTRVPTNGDLKSPLLVVVGLGPTERLTAAEVRRAAGVAARAVGKAGVVALALPAGDSEHVRAVVDGFALGGYRFDDYKPSASHPAPTEVVVLTGAARDKTATTALHTAEIVAAAVRRTRDWVNTPPGDLTPPLFADAVVAAAKDRPTPKGSKPGKVTVKVIDEKQLAAGGFGGIIGVGQGSANPPRLVQLTYKPRGAKQHLALVGKGITYDSGGLTIKPGASMKTMKKDMAGAAAVASATLAIADLGLPVAVTTLVPMAENMPSGSAVRPGDVLEMYGGKTVEVLNTDAEGRLVLADALVLACEQKPDVVVDVATLTGAAERALGDRVSALFGNDEELVARARAAGERVELAAELSAL
jgi:leucyl aminopeptidase